MQKTLSEVRVEEHILMFVDVHNYSLAFDDPIKSYGFLQAMYETLGDLIVKADGDIIKYLVPDFIKSFRVFVPVFRRYRSSGSVSQTGCRTLQTP